MEQVVIGYNSEDFITGETVRSFETGYLIAPDIAVVPCLTALYFVRIKPSPLVENTYDDCGEIASFDVPVGCTKNIDSLPAEALAVAMWVAESQRAPLAVAV